MNEGHYIALRSYLEEHSSLLRQILEELKAQGATPGMSPQAVANAIDKRLKEVFAAEPVHDIDPGIKQLSQLTALPAPVVNSKPEKAASASVRLDMGNLGPISADTGEPVRPKPTAKKGK